MIIKLLIQRFIIRHLSDSRRDHCPRLCYWSLIIPCLELKNGSFQFTLHAYDSCVLALLWWTRRDMFTVFCDTAVSMSLRGEICPLLKPELHPVRRSLAASSLCSPQGHHRAAEMSRHARGVFYFIPWSICGCSSYREGQLCNHNQRLIPDLIEDT